MGQGNIFNEVQVQKPNKSVFDLSHDVKTTINMGDLVPILCEETLPGDKWSISAEALLRMMPMVSPIMHKVDVYTHFFYVPNRILWDRWEQFINPSMVTGVSSAVSPFYNMAESGVSIGTLEDYMGLPICPGSLAFTPENVNALPFIAYQKIWYEYYRDQNLELTTWETFQDYFDIQDGLQSSTTKNRITQLRRRAWEHDYFTSCLPFAQKGSAVPLPIELSVPIDLPVTYDTSSLPVPSQVLRDPITGAIFAGAGDVITQVFGGSGPAQLTLDDGMVQQKAGLDPNGSLNVSGTLHSTAVSTTINDLRTAYAMQRFLEKNARGGTRYTEGLLMHFNVRSSDARLQRPEYLGGMKSTMSISEVLQTSSTDLTSPQGGMAGHGITVSGGNRLSYFCEEHGWIFAILSVRPKTSYHQGIRRHFSKLDRFDYAWPDFAMLGEEQIKNKELFFDPSDNPYNETPFGYLPRYSEYRFIPSKVTGDIHDTLDFWSLHRSFDPLTPPTLNYEFVGCNPSNRIWAVDPTIAGTRTMFVQAYFNISCLRPLPRYGTPAL